ncbi:hypothetical protein RHGRI_005750 [Rhododendron griersonianum]|uniref:Uncharacterized protein n=1 Tax=Rhododendron griersonianum TaxID=479676 RepID=A0AAV6LDT9_9ERIC|nr:hypothetical protein RHGRI_005750 [Rhododendron griersonianum]
MNGFVQQAFNMEVEGMARTIMSGFKPELVPVYTELANEFVVFDPPRRPSPTSSTFRISAEKRGDESCGGGISAEKRGGKSCGGDISAKMGGGESGGGGGDGGGGGWERG